jgi:DNA end-binding protein Ku
MEYGMAGPRANWKGFIRFGEVSAPVALYSAATASDRISFNILNRKTGNRVRREYFDSETGAVVDKDDQIKGFEIENGLFVRLEADEVAAAVPESDKTMTVLSFVPLSEIDEVYFDKPYFLTPDKTGSETFTLLRDGMKRAKVAAIARTVLFRRMRTVLIRPEGTGLLAATLNFDYEVRSADEAFGHMPDLKIEGEMLDLAKHIIKTKIGEFRPEEFEDRYESALHDLVQAKLEGRPMPRRAEPQVSQPNDLLKALRESAQMLRDAAEPRRTPRTKTVAGKAEPSPAKERPAAPRRKAGTRG